ncbi:unnamed protein product [Rotaria sp. Silwood2]|nr:unnamed protein product [Rotaria sp. Silwood2]CAF3158575.1 unnamed protein product [Rotaria sp. Silwood2]CAF4486235.1 unnamed protein product [Rotaria sp. Silwood2]CAF4518457.1 unnamed protein product [Rotaria sp. Silwood2]
MNGRDRLNYTTMMIVNSNFLVSNAYYGVVLEYNTTNYGDANATIQSSTRGKYQLIKMANTLIPTSTTKFDVTSDSAVISLMWPIEIPYFELQTNAKLNGMNTSLPVVTVQNETYLIRKYQFQNLSSDTSYTLTTLFTKIYLPNNQWIESVESTSTITTFPKSASEKLAYQQVFLLSVFNILFFNLFSSFI